MLITHFNLPIWNTNKREAVVGKVSVNITNPLLLEHLVVFAFEGVWAKSQHPKQKGLLKQR